MFIHIPLYGLIRYSYIVQPTTMKRTSFKSSLVVGYFNRIQRHTELLSYSVDIRQEYTETGDNVYSSSEYWWYMYVVIPCPYYWTLTSRPQTSLCAPNAAPYICTYIFRPVARTAKWNWPRPKAEHLSLSRARGELGNWAFCREECHNYIWTKKITSLIATNI